MFGRLAWILKAIGVGDEPLSFHLAGSVLLLGTH